MTSVIGTGRLAQGPTFASSQDTGLHGSSSSGRDLWRSFATSLAIVCRADAQPPDPALAELDLNPVTQGVVARDALMVVR